MTYFASLFSSPAYINLPQQAAGWIGFLLLFALLGRGLASVREKPMALLSLKGALLALLTLSIPLTSLSFGIQPDLLAAGGADDYSTVILVLSAIPWVIAADLLGSLPSLVLAVISGVFFAFWGTHSLFTPLEFGLAALVFNRVLRQKFILEYRALTRHPIMAGMAASAFLLFLMMFANFFAAEGGLAARLDAALVSVWQMWLARIAALMAAAAVGEVLYILLQNEGDTASQQGSAPRTEKPVYSGFAEVQAGKPAQKFIGTTTLIIVILFGCLTLDWLFATQTAKNLLKEGRKPEAVAAGQALGTVYHSARLTVEKLAAVDITATPTEELPAVFDGIMENQPAVYQFYLFDTAGNVLYAYPQPAEGAFAIMPEEWEWLDARSTGLDKTSLTMLPREAGRSSTTALAGTVRGADGSLAGLVTAHLDFGAEFLERAGLPAANGSGSDGWAWRLVDDAGKLVAGSGLEASWAASGAGKTRDKATFSYTFQGAPWKLEYFVPDDVLQSTAFQVAAPQMGLLILLGMAALVLVQNNARRVSKIIRSISTETVRPAPGSKERLAQADPHDEIERLKSAFEAMNNSLNDRLGELGRLLTVSQKIASSLKVEENMRSILDAALVSKVGSARILLDNLATDEVEEQSEIQLGSGELTGEFAYLDDQMYELMRYQDMLVVRNTLRIRRIEMPEGRKHPGALVAFAVNHDGHYHGVLWVAYEEPYDIPDEEIRYLQMLAGDASVAAANYHLFSSAEIGKQRLEAVLAATPEPVLVMDASDRLLLLNPAAIVLPGLVSDSAPGQKVRDILISRDLLDVLQAHKGDQVTTGEIKLENNRTYHVSVSSVIANGAVVGKVCNLRDITHYKETDTLKSDFVATVSHDLRSPLALMKGWTTMISMVGELNDQQAGYAEKIMAGIGDMERLVNNVLDLEKIEMNRGLTKEKIVAIELVNHAIESLQLQANQKKIDIDFEHEINPAVTFDGDRDLMHLALVNLIDNAIKFNQVAGKVRLGAKVEGGRLLFTVKDDGIGIAPLDQPKLFDRYFRSNRREAVQQRGSGLGLTIVKSIADLHNGRVWVESQLGKGSTFYLEVPV